MSIINSTQANYYITYNIICEGVYHYKVPIIIKKCGGGPYIIGEKVYVCEPISGYGFGISKQNCFKAGYYDRDSCRELTIE